MSHTALLAPTRSLGASLKIVTPPTSEPITLTLAKAWLRRDDTAEDTLIGSLITAARMQVEQDSHQLIPTQTWDLAVDRLPSDNELDLLVAPVQAVTAFTTYDEDDNSSSFASSNYYVDLYREPARLLLNHDAEWPSDLRAHVAAVIRIRAGYVGTALTVSSITRSSTTATVTTSTAHGLSTGAVVTIAGADQGDYNTTTDVTVTSTTAFTYTVSGSPATPATGTITATPTGVPEWANLAIRMRLAAFYEQREMSDSEQRLYEWLIDKVHHVGD